MKKELFDELVKSVREGGAILRGEIKPSRVFHHPTPPADYAPEQRFAVCIQTHNPELLEPRKLYQVTMLGDDAVKVTDEAGEAAIYPTDFFVLIDLTPEAEQAILRSAEQA